VKALFIIYLICLTKREFFSRLYGNDKRYKREKGYEDTGYDYVYNIKQLEPADLQCVVKVNVGGVRTAFEIHCISDYGEIWKDIGAIYSSKYINFTLNCIIYYLSFIILLYIRT